MTGCLGPTLTCSIELCSRPVSVLRACGRLEGWPWTESLGIDGSKLSVSLVGSTAGSSLEPADSASSSF